MYCVDWALSAHQSHHNLSVSLTICPPHHTPLIYDWAQTMHKLKHICICVCYGRDSAFSLITAHLTSNSFLCSVQKHDRFVIWRWNPWFLNSRSCSFPLTDHVTFLCWKDTEPKLVRAGYPQFFPRCLIISTLIPLPSLGWSKATAAAHLNLTFPFILPVMFTPCFSPSSLLQDAWFQRDHRTNQRPIPAHQWPVSHFRWRLKGTSAPGAPTALRASASPLRESWTATRTKKTRRPPQSAVWWAQSLEKP